MALIGLLAASAPHIFSHYEAKMLYMNKKCFTFVCKKTVLTSNLIYKVFVQVKLISLA